jgi:aminoglycoside phosphotransferase (APT) family kinase protein
MTLSAYLWTTARELRTTVMPAIDDPSVRETLHNGLRIITWIANALEQDAPDGTTAPDGTGVIADTDRLQGPAENAAAWRGSGAAIANHAANIDTAGHAALAENAAAISWEKAALDQAIARVDAIEYGTNGASESRPAYAIRPEPLQQYLRRRFAAPALAITSCVPIHGGRSRQTALFSVEGCDDLPREMVVQRGLPGGGTGPGFIDETTQFDLMAALLAAGMRIPKPVLVETEDPALGAAFIVVERASGRCAEPDFWQRPKDRSLVCDLAREMALLHSYDPGSQGTKLPQARESYDEAGWLAELDQLARAWHADRHWPSVTMSAAIEWMRANAGCIEDRRGLVHNDFLFHNIMAENGSITAVLDWEMTSIGHPGEDLGYAYPVIKACGNWPEFLEAYRNEGGTDISQREIDYFALRAGLRLMNMVMTGGRNVFESGKAAGVLPASAGAHFTQRLLHRIAGVLEDVLNRDTKGDTA